MTPRTVRELVACPRCGAPIGARCRTLHRPYGPPSVSNHLIRTRKAEAILDSPPPYVTVFLDSPEVGP